MAVLPLPRLLLLLLPVFLDECVRSDGGVIAAIGVPNERVTPYSGIVTPWVSL